MLEWRWAGCCGSDARDISLTWGGGLQGNNAQAATARWSEWRSPSLRDRVEYVQVQKAVEIIL